MILDDHDKLQEECGVFGIYSKTENVAINTYWGLYALQHRGQESAGITVADGTKMECKRGMGLVAEAMRDNMPTLEGHIAIGHVRYSTTGSSLITNTQPLMVRYAEGPISLAHNGNLTNAHQVRTTLERQGSVFQTTIDTEVIVHLIARSSKSCVEDRIIESVAKVEGAYSLVIMTENKLIGLRDPHGFRPLALGKLNGGYVIASETCAFNTIGAQFIRDIEPGEMVVIDEQGLKSINYAESKKRALCIFEYIYFARPDSTIDGQSVYQARLAMGRQLAREHKVKADIVISVPDSGTTAALGYSAESGIPFAEGLIKNRYIGRTFIQPDQKKRDLSVKLKLNAVESVVKGKSIVMVDDSIVRGTTSSKIVNMLREAGAKEIHFCVSSPPIAHTCHYGIDTSVRKELIAATKSVEEIKDFIGADTLHYLTMEGLSKALQAVKPDFLCSACFTGAYPLKKSQLEELGGAKHVFEK